uniref:protein-serine/threonine phosphatase n=1 Tax=Picea sitchensis TaxID=3332 RepID=A9NPS8_PICSI|nr:unknown [Picea sitchensis]
MYESGLMRSGLRILSALNPLITRPVSDLKSKWSSLRISNISTHIFNNNNNRSELEMMRMAFDSSGGTVANPPPSSRQHFGPISGGGLSEDRRVTFGYSSFQGKRATMEDFYDAKISKFDDQMVGLFGVFDGHGGSRAAEYLKQHLFENLINHPQFATDTKLALSETYQQTDSEFLKAETSIYRDDGSTASTAVLVGDRLYVANVGDSRAVILKAGEAIPLSEDHKPNRSDERQRIEQAGGNVMWAGTWRVGGVLAVSRAFGNRLLKRFVVAEPEIQEEIIKDDVEFLVIASDGLWDVISNEDAVSLVKSIEDPEAAARKLTETAYAKGSADNITCVVVRFNHSKNVLT